MEKGGVQEEGQDKTVYWLQYFQKNPTVVATLN
jgi:hypothetical protein